MKAKANVHLLPSDKSLYHLSQNKMILTSIDQEGMSIKYRSYPIQIYITFSQSELEISKIEEGDLCINKYGNSLYRRNSLEDCAEWEKVIASTDNSLKVRDKCICSEEESITCGKPKAEGLCQQLIPLIPEYFVSLFIYEYNKGNIIKNVEIELSYQGATQEDSCGNIMSIPTLKLNQDNEVIVTVLKEKKYDKEEVAALCRKAYLAAIAVTEDGWNGAFAGVDNPNIEEIFGKYANNWISKNLK